MPITLIYDGQRQIFDVAAPDTRSSGVTSGVKPSLARFLWLERRLPPRPLCNGIGRCGRCRVRFLAGTPEPVAAEVRMLSEAEISAGVRLACRHTPQEGMVIEVENTPLSPTLPTPSEPKPAHHTAYVPGDAAKTLRLAVDLGTTSVAWQAQDEAGNTLAAGQILNPQMCAGSDVMARLAEGATPDGAKMLHTVMGEFLRDTVEHLRDELGPDWTVDTIGLAANPAMTALALGLDASGLRAAPYTLPQELTSDLGASFGPEYFADVFPPFLGDVMSDDEKGNRTKPPIIWTPPALSPFVGGDVSAGLAVLLDKVPSGGLSALSSDDDMRPFLLADMGTNGEFLFLPAENPSPSPLLVTSVPLGPALEGVGMSCGGLVGPGGVTSFRVGPDGLTPVTWDGGHPRHICGTGYLSLLRHLRLTGLLDENGHFCDEASAALHATKAGTKTDTPLGPLEFLRKRLAATLTTYAGERGLPLPGGLFLSGGDVERLLQVKAAFSLAIERLLAAANLAPSLLKHVWLAGALGEHAPLDALVELGFLPAEWASKTTAVGNTSLRGVALLLRDTAPHDVSLRQRLAHTLSPRRVLDLASDPGFHQDYIRHMRFRAGSL